MANKFICSLATSDISKTRMIPNCFRSLLCRSDHSQTESAYLKYEKVFPNHVTCEQYKARHLRRGRKQSREEGNKKVQISRRH